MWPACTPLGLLGLLRSKANCPPTLAESHSSTVSKLTRTQQRLLAQAERVVSMRSVFGEHAERPYLPELVAQWRAIEDNQDAERLAASTPRSAGAIA